MWIIGKKYIDLKFYHAIPDRLVILEYFSLCIDITHIINWIDNHRKNKTQPASLNIKKINQKYIYNEYILSYLHT